MLASEHVPLTKASFRPASVGQTAVHTDRTLASLAELDSVYPVSMVIALLENQITVIALPVLLCSKIVKKHFPF